MLLAVYALPATLFVDVTLIYILRMLYINT